MLPRRASLLLGVVCVLALFVGLGRPCLWEPDEPRFAEATRQMVDRGDVLTPWFNGQPRFEKPILLYWLQLPFVAVLGPTETAARLPAALAGLGCVVLTYLIGSTLLGPTAAWVGALTLATLFRFATYARQGLTDVPALFFELLAIHGFLRSRADGAPRAAWVVAWAATGLAAATKGPVAVIPVAIWGAFLIAVRDWRGVARMRIVPGALVAAAIAAPWYLAMLALHGRPFVDVALGTEVVSRVGGTFGPRRGVAYYFGVWPADMLPWTPFFLLALVYVGVARARLDPGARRAVALLVTWFVAVVAIFSLAGVKVPHYLLPAYPAGALLVGLLVERASTDPSARRLWWVGAWLATLALGLAAVLVGALALRAGGPAMRSLWFVLPSILAGGTAAALAVGWRRGPVVASAAIAATLAVALGYAALAVVPRLEGLQPVPPLGRAIAAAAGPGDRVGHYGSYGWQGLAFYSRHDVATLSTLDEVARFLDAPGRAYCVLPGRDAETVEGMAPGRVHELARRPKLVVRFNRLFGQRPIHDDALVLVTNGPGDRSGRADPSR
jgi:4-amino-4-deoxy-L-arabinose transferase-like glycosyltransferase